MSYRVIRSWILKSIQMFPCEISKDRFHISICGTQGLKSTRRDAYAMSISMKRLGFKSLIAIDNFDDIEWLKSRLPEVKTTISLDHVTQTLDLIRKSSVPTDVLISISAHGYTSGHQSNYFIFDGRKVDRKIMRPWFEGFDSRLHHIVVIIDTCHSGNMTGFQRHGLCLADGQIASPITLSGCRQTQCLMEDISDEFGYGGGLTAAFVDAIKSGIPFNVGAVADQCKSRIAKLGATIVVTTASTTRLAAEGLEIESLFEINPLIQRLNARCTHRREMMINLSLIGSLMLAFKFLPLQLFFLMLIGVYDFEPHKSTLVRNLIFSGLLMLMPPFMALFHVANVRFLTYIATELHELYAFYMESHRHVCDNSLVRQQQILDTSDLVSQP